MLAPVLVQDEQEFLGAAEGEDGHQHAPAPVEDAGDGLHKGLLALYAGNVGGDAVGRLGDEDVDLDASRNFGGDKMSVFLAGVVASEEDFETGDLDQEHGGAKNVAGWVGCDADRGDGVGSVVVDRLDHGEGLEMVFLSVDEGGCWVGRCVADTDTVLDKPFVDSLGGMGHEDSASEVGLGQDIW